LFEGIRVKFYHKEDSLRKHTEEDSDRLDRLEKAVIELQKRVEALER
jgi:hypothetical protein